jgi:hypothetical protein
MVLRMFFLLVLILNVFGPGVPPSGTGDGGSPPVPPPHFCVGPLPWLENPRTFIEFQEQGDTLFLTVYLTPSRWIDGSPWKFARVCEKLIHLTRDVYIVRMTRMYTRILPLLPDEDLERRRPPKTSDVEETWLRNQSFCSSRDKDPTNVRKRDVFTTLTDVCEYLLSE